MNAVLITVSKVEIERVQRLSAAFDSLLRREESLRAIASQIPRGRSWWTSLEETGHWVLVVSKKEFQIGFDPWGFPQGELMREVLALVPKPPAIITAQEIATRLSRTGEPSVFEFRKAIQRCLRELREEQVVQSCPVGRGSQLGWHLPGIIRAASSPAAQADPVSSAPKPAERLPIVMGTSSTGTGRRVPHVGLLHKVLALVPEAPASITSSALADLIEGESAIPVGQARKAVQAQLRELQLRKLVTATRASGADQLGWCRQ